MKLSITPLRFVLNLIKNNTGWSSKNFFLIAVTIVGIGLLVPVIYLLIVDAYYNHSIRTDLSGLAQYVGSVAALFASAGITKAWSEKYENKKGPPDPPSIDN